MSDPFVQFKLAQREGWAHFAPLETFTTPCAAHLVKHARVRAGQKVLDVGCGTGVVAVTAARHGATATGLDLTPELLTRARENASIAGVEIDWREGDAEALPFKDAAFDVVLSQFGHIFAPRPDVVIGEMLRVLAPGGTIAFSTWPPEMFIGRMFSLVGSYMPPPPPGASPPVQWGEPVVIRERLGAAVGEIVFARSEMLVPALSPQHSRVNMERTAGPVIKMIATLIGKDEARLAQFRAEYERIVAEFFEQNIVRQDFLMTRAVKRT